MIDPKHLRQDIEKTAERLRIRGYTLPIKEIEALETKRKALQTDTQNLQNKRNEQSKRIGQLKAKGENVEALLAEMSQVNTLLKTYEEQLLDIQNAFKDIQLNIPNIPDEAVPPGKSEADNVVVRTVGAPRKFAFKPKDHVELGDLRQQMDFTRAAKISGARFVVLHHQLAFLQRALIQFMLDVHTKQHGYRECYVPYLVNSASLYGTGQLPKFAEDLFAVNSEHELFLIPTAEVPLTNLVRDEILAANSLPIKWVAHTPCFRSEAGSYGKDTRGMIRQHQFEKVELVQIVKPEDSDKAHEELTQHAEKILQMLELPYQVALLCGADLSFTSTKTFDLEVWLPGQERYREISSCSNFKDFHARRMQARWRNPTTNKPELVHTLNGSALAVGRTLVAILENYQDENGQIHIPEALVPYMGGLTVINN
jgi:seryl-tRNA synthetase